jgi:hypothetical protein
LSLDRAAARHLDDELALMGHGADPSAHLYGAGTAVRVAGMICSW